MEGQGPVLATKRDFVVVCKKQQVALVSYQQSHQI